jgi:hypothetical protein
MPSLKAIHICNSHKPKHKPKIAKEYVLANAETRPKKKYDRTTMAIRNAGLSADMKVFTFNKISAKLKGNCLEIPHYA